MKKMNLLIVAASFVALSACASKRHQAEQQTPPPTPAQQAEANLAGERDAYVGQTQTRIDEMKKFAADLRARAETTPKPQKKKMQNAADDMDSALRDVEKELADVKDAAPANWLDEKRDVTKTMQRAETQYSSSITLLR